MGGSETTTTTGGAGSGGAPTTVTTGGTGGIATTTTGGAGGVGGEGGMGGADPCAACTTIASFDAGSEPTGLFVDDANVFVTLLGTGEVIQMEKDGTGEVTLTSGEDSPIAVFARDGLVYWASYSIEGVLRSAPVGGGAVTDLVVAPAAREIYVTPDFILWTREPDDVQQIPITGSPDGMTALLLSGNLLTQGLTADDEAIYWVNRQDGNVKRGAFDLTGETPLAIGDVPWDVAVDDTSIYWTESGAAPMSGKVVMADKTDGSGAVVLSADEARPVGIAIDESHVYWANEEDGSVKAVPIGGGAVKIVMGGLSKPANVAVDATSVYVTDAGGDAVIKAPKPQ